MDTNLISSDMDKFLKKYSKFIKKDIYISKEMYKRFLTQYDYLFEELQKSKYLYENTPKYKKIMALANDDRPWKTHTLKYLQDATSKYEEFLQKFDLDTRNKQIIFCDEDELLIIEPKNKLNLIYAKVRYLLDIKNFKEKQILVLTSSKPEANLILEKFKNNGLNEIEVYDKLSFINERSFGNTILTREREYQILLSYVTKKIFPNKDEFNKLYLAFKPYIYLNREYKDYDTFKDYHNYMYKRMFIASGLSLKKFNEREISKRKKYLRTIKGETTRTKEEVDIANFLFLNSCSYVYDSDNSVFNIVYNDNIFTCRFEDLPEPTFKKDTSEITLYNRYLNKSTYLENLAYELIKKRFPLEKMESEEVYNTLRNTSMDSYFSEFINNYLMPTLNYYHKYKDFKKTKLGASQKEELLKIYTYLENYMLEEKIIWESEMLKNLAKKLEGDNYKYLFLVEMENYAFKVNVANMKLVSKSKDVELLKEDIKLNMDYKKYLLQNKALPISDVYQNKEELKELTNKFLSENVGVINKRLEQNNNPIYIYLYDDSKRLNVDKNISLLTYNLLKTNFNKSVVIGLSKLVDIKHLLIDNYFSKTKVKEICSIDGQKITYDKLVNIKNNYDYIFMPYIIMDKYHDDILTKDMDYHFKIMLYLGVMRARKGIVILCPSSRKKDLAYLKKIKSNVIICD